MEKRRAAGNPDRRAVGAPTPTSTAADRVLRSDLEQYRDWLLSGAATDADAAFRLGARGQELSQLLVTLLRDLDQAQTELPRWAVERARVSGWNEVSRDLPPELAQPAARIDTLQEQIGSIARELNETLMLLAAQPHAMPGADSTSG